jgi:leucyl aminopeptidase
VDVLFRAGDPLQEATGALIVPVVATEGLDNTGLGETVARLDAMLGGELAPLAADARFTGARKSVLVVPTLGRLPTRRLVLTGLGPAAELSPEEIRRAWGIATTTARDAGATLIVSMLPPTETPVDANAALSAAAEGARLAAYRFTKHFGAGQKADAAPREVESLTFVDDGVADAEAMTALARAERIAAATNLARDLVNEPASVLTPAVMADHARRVSAEAGLEIAVYGPTELAAMGAGAIVAVGKGSANEPRLIHLTYRPDANGDAEGARRIGLVGKCITFDTGGYSIKTREGILDMKTDMAGGAAVLGTMSVLRELGCRHVVHGVICAAENMISDRAFRPDDILTALNGVTIEIVSTDAEGRLVLADGLTFTARQGVDEMIDLATLTGAAVVALGPGTTALFANRDDLADRFLTAASAVGERTWRMPLIDDLNSQIKGSIGDVKNSGGRHGGAITAALFLARFTDDTPWAHLDIAGSARVDKTTGYTPRGATGVGVRSLLAYLTT